MEEVKLTKAFLAENQQSLTGEIRNRLKEASLYKNQMEVMKDKFVCLTNNLGLIQAQFKIVASGVKTNLEKLSDADEKFKVKSVDGYGKKLMNPEIKNKPKLISRFCRAFACDKKKVSKSDDEYVIADDK